MIIFPKLNMRIKKALSTEKIWTMSKFIHLSSWRNLDCQSSHLSSFFLLKKTNFSSVVLAEYSPLFAGQRRRGQRANERPVSRSCDHSRPMRGQRTGAEGTRRDMNSTQPWRQQQLLQSSWPLIGREWSHDLATAAAAAVKLQQSTSAFLIWVKYAAARQPQLPALPFSSWKLATFIYF